MGKFFKVSIGDSDVALQLATGTFAAGRVGHDVSTIVDGRVTLTTAGVAQQLSTVSLAAKYAIISPLYTNTGIMAVGGSTVLATATQARGVCLVTGDPPLTVPCTDLSNIYFNGTFANGTVTYIALG